MRDEKHRDRIFIEGLRLAEEALRSDLEIFEAFISDGLIKNERSEALLQKIASKKIDSFLLPEKIFRTISDTKSSPGIILIAGHPPTGKKQIAKRIAHLKAENPLLILLHEINNPSNLGAILRTAEAAGVEGIILSKRSASPFSPKALRGAMGAAFRLPVWRNADFFEALDWAGKRGLISVYADAGGAQDYTRFDFFRPCLLVFGSEAHGLSKSEKNRIDESVRISLANEVESLNLAVACGIILFEAKRQKVR